MSSELTRWIQAILSPELPRGIQATLSPEFPRGIQEILSPELPRGIQELFQHPHYPSQFGIQRWCTGSLSPLDPPDRDSEPGVDASCRFLTRPIDFGLDPKELREDFGFPHEHWDLLMPAFRHNLHCTNDKQVLQLVHTACRELRARGSAGVDPERVATYIIGLRKQHVCLIRRRADIVRRELEKKEIVFIRVHGAFLEDHDPQFDTELMNQYEHEHKDQFSNTLAQTEFRRLDALAGHNKKQLRERQMTRFRSMLNEFYGGRKALGGSLHTYGATAMRPCGVRVGVVLGSFWIRLASFCVRLVSFVGSFGVI